MQKNRLGNFPTRFIIEPAFCLDVYRLILIKKLPNSKVRQLMWSHSNHLLRLG